VPDFSLLERNGQRVTKADLLGKVWIADFIFTRCVEQCPLVNSRMVALQQAFAAEDDVRLVSISVDPEHDTPDVLTRYAAGLGAHPQRWLFLTGDKAHIYALAREGFRLGVFEAQTSSRTSMRPWWQSRPGLKSVLQLLGPAEARAHHGAHSQGGARQTIQHSARLVLVDRRGRIRQYYDSNDDRTLTRLQGDVHALLRER
jgi:cytochrome oxidase Cu insertion factor (SCO1/SenC/PrrC family)